MFGRRLSPFLATVPGWLFISAEWARHSSWLWIGWLIWTGIVLWLSWRARRVPAWASPLVGMMPLLILLGIIRAVTMGAQMWNAQSIVPTVWLTLLGMYAILAVLGSVQRILHLRSSPHFSQLILLSVILISGSVLFNLMGMAASFRLQGMAPPDLRIMAWMHFPRALVYQTLITAMVLVSALLVRKVVGDAPYLVLGAIGSAGFVLWSFWLEFDYGLIGSGYAYLLSLWFAFWLMVLLPMLSLTKIGQRFPTGMLVAHLFMAFVGVAALAAVVRVHPALLHGVLSLLGIPVRLRSYPAPGVGSLSGPFGLVFLRFLLEYGSMAFTGLAAYVLSTPADEEPAALNFRLTSVPSQHLFSLLGTWFLIVFLLGGCAPATPVTSTSPSAPESAPSVVPTTLPGIVMVEGTVTDVMLSAKVILLETENGPVNVALTDQTRILGSNGEPIQLRDIHPGYVIRATGRPGTGKSVIPDEVRVLKAVAKPTPPTKGPQTLPPTPGPVPIRVMAWHFGAVSRGGG